MPTTLRCTCGASLNAANVVDGRIRCPSCKKVMRVSTRQAAAPAAADRAEGATAVGQRAPGWPILPTIAVAGAVPVLVILFTALVLGTSPGMIAAGIVILALIPLLAVAYLMMVKGRALREHKREVDLFAGLVKLILWDPTEGILLLRNKQIDFVDDNCRDGGGLRFLYPPFGQELGLRVPLTLQTVEFEDTNVYTRDSIPLFMRVMIWWRIKDLREYYLSVSQEVHQLNDRRSHSEGGTEGRGAKNSAAAQLEAAELWVAMTAEEEARAFVSGISTSLLVADQIMADLPREISEPDTDEIVPDFGHDQPRDRTDMYQTATNLLTERLHPRLREKLLPRGIEVDRVALQEVRLPEEIHQQAIEAAKAWYALIEARRQGRGEAARLQELANVIGSEAVGKSEMLKNLQGMTLYQLPRFLDDLFAQRAGSADLRLEGEPRKALPER